MAHLAFALRFSSVRPFIGVLAVLMVSGTARAEITEEQPVHHFYNARLLQPGEVQISVASNSKVGVTETMELGSNGLMLLAGMPNLSVKHQMFRGKGYQTSFSGHLIYAEADASEGVNTTDPESTGDGNGDDTGGGTSKTVIFPMGVTNTFDLSSDLFVNAGVFDYFVYNQTTNFDASTVYHIFTPSLGMDYVVNDHIALTALTAYPVYMYLELNSDVAEISGTLDFTKLPPKLSPSLSWLTATFSSGSFNAEVGYFFAANQPVGIIGNYYVNLFWRWYV